MLMPTDRSDQKILDIGIKTAARQVAHLLDVEDRDNVSDAVALLIDFRLYELRQVSQRLLPAEVTRLQRNDIRQAFLDDI